MANRLDFNALKTRAAQRVAEHADRDVMFQKLERMFLMMQDEERKVEDWIKVTLSPDPHVAVIGVVRLMTSTDPQFSIASDPDDPASVERADKLEKVCETLWYRINRARQIPLHYEACLSAALFAEVAILVANVAETVKFAKTNGRDVGRMERMAQECPYSVRVINPRCVYPEYDEFGLASVLWRQVRRAGAVRQFWGKLAEKADLGDDKTLVTYNEYWDEKWRVVWCNDGDPILMERHGLPFLPWVCTTVTGSNLFDNPKHQRHPMLYPILAGNWWHRQNLLLTQMFSSVGLLMQPAWEINTIDGRDIPIDLSAPGQHITLRTGESVKPLQRQLIDPSVQVGLQYADKAMLVSTLPRVVFGESPGATMSYSAINLLSQAGRLPIVPVERQVGKALSDAFLIVLHWIHESGEKLRLRGRNAIAEVAPSDIDPDNLEVTVKLKADIPQDRLQLANVVSLLRNQRGPDGMPLISAETARQFLEFMQPGDEEQRIALELLMGKYLQEKLKAPLERVEARQQQQPVGVPPVQLAPPVVPGTAEQQATLPEMGMFGEAESANY